MDSQVVVKHLEAQAVASIVIPGIPRGAAADAFHGALPDVFSHLHAHAIALAGPPFARFHAGVGDTVDVEIGFPFAPGSHVPETDTIKVRALPAGETATIVHSGSYDDAVDALAQWKAAHARVSAGPPWESYLDRTRAELHDPLAPPT